MDISNLTITKETRNEMGKQLSKTKKSELRLAKLRELAESGKLKFIKTRGDLAEAVGYPYMQRSTSGYSWVNYQIQKGILKERITGYGDSGLAEYEYEYVPNPPRPNPLKEELKVAEPKRQAKTVNEMLKDAFDEPEGMVINIVRGDMTVCIENANKAVLAEIIKAIKE